MFHTSIIETAAIPARKENRLKERGYDDDDDDDDDRLFS
jgi:hypothetical protein